MSNALSPVGYDLDRDDLGRSNLPHAELSGCVVVDGTKRIRPTFAKAGCLLSMNAVVGPAGWLAYSPTLDDDDMDEACREAACNDKGRCRITAEIVDGWAVLERGTFATVAGFIVTAGIGSRDYVDGTIYGSESEALRRAAQERGEYGVVEVMTIMVNVERQGRRLAFYGPIIGEL
jgi:hypothetical protein